jgi:hypothetical protein
MSKRRSAVRPRSRAVPRVKVFISHATVDRRRAQRLGRLLEECGIEYWFSREHLVHGHNWYREIGAALTGCNWLVVVATKASVKNSWVRDEVTFALTEQRYRNRVIPLLFETCTLKRLAWSLKSIQYLDFRSGWQPGGDQLVERIGGRRPRRRP